jgi:hypothetical protein
VIVTNAKFKIRIVKYFIFIFLVILFYFMVRSVFLKLLATVAV